MTNNESCAPVGLLDILKEIKTSRNKLDDLTERMQTAMDANRDASSMSDELQEVMKRNQAMWKSGYDEGYKAGRNSEIQASETGSTTSHEQDIDEDEPDQYPPEKWGGTK
jgi:hypothetical protein